MPLRGVISFTIHVTITSKYLKSIAHRIELGASIDDKEMLHFILLRILKVLIEIGASIDFNALDGVTAFTYAVIYKQKEMAEFLIENGANVNSTCTNLKTPLHFALMLNHEEFVLLLLQNGASVNAKDQDKRTPIEGLMRKQMTAFNTMLAYA